MFSLVFYVFGWFEWGWWVSHTVGFLFSTITWAVLEVEASVVHEKQASFCTNITLLFWFQSLHQVPSHVFSKVPVTFVFGINRINSLEKVNSEEEEEEKNKQKSPQLESTCGLCDPGSRLSQPPPPSFLKACFHLCLIYLVGLFRLEIDHKHFLRSFFFPQVDNYWQVSGLGREGWANAFLQMTVRQGKIEFSFPSIHACGARNRQW